MTREFSPQTRHYFFVNALTVSRAVAALGSSLLTLSGNPNIGMIINSSVWGITEIDGRLARRWHVTSRPGAFRDYIADASCANAGILALDKGIIEPLISHVSPAVDIQTFSLIFVFGSMIASTIIFGANAHLQCQAPGDMDYLPSQD